MDQIMQNLEVPIGKYDEFKSIYIQSLWWQSTLVST